MSCDIPHHRQALEKKKKRKFRWWKADNSVSNDSRSHEINDKFVLWANVQDILILQHFASDIYVCRRRFHYHKACLIFLSCVRGPPHYRWLSALDLEALSVSPSPPPAVSMYFRSYTHDRVNRARGQQRGEEEERECGVGWGGEASTEDMVPTREAHRASVPSLQLRALIRLIVSNIETHNKHNTWRPFAILISPSQPARTTQLQPSGISLIWLQNNDTIIAMATLLLHPMSSGAGRILIHRSARRTKWISQEIS